MSTHYITGIAGIPTETVTIALPRKWARNGDKPAIILLPGTGEGTLFPFNPAVAQPLIKALTDAGFPVGCATPINQWGNDYCRLWISSIRAHMQSVLGARAGKIGLIGLSQGGFNVLSWAGANPSLTGAVTGYLAPPDLEFAASAQGYGTAVNNAYGGTYSEATMGAQYNPQTMAENGAYAGIPIELVYASNDDIVPLSMQTAFKNAVGSNVIQVNGGATGHSWDVTTSDVQILPRLVAQMSSF